MIGTIRKHKAWVWAIVITATIVSFVFYFNPNARYSDRRGGGGNYGTINGRAITQSEYADAYREAELWYFFSAGDWPDRAGRQNSFDVERETYYRLFLIQKVNELKISVASEVVGSAARAKLASLNNGKPVTLDEFATQRLQPHGLTKEDLARFLQHDLAIRQLFSLVGSSGDLLTPQEARMLYVRENQEITAQAVFFAGSNYLAGVTPTPEAVGQFYTNELANYRLPERVQVSYVEFPLTNFWNEVAQDMAKDTNLSHNIDLEILQRGTNYFGGARTEAEAKIKLREAYQHDLALIKARKAANDYAMELFDTNSLANFVRLARQKGLTVKVTEPFDRVQGPKEFSDPKLLSTPINFARVAFGRTPDEPCSGAVPGETAVYVMALNKRLPSEIPSFESIRAQVVADYTRAQSTQLARQAAINFFNIVTNAVAAGKSFDVVSLEQRVTPVSLPSFSLSTRELPEAEKHINLATLQQAAFGVMPRHANIAATDDGGVVVFVNDRLPVDLAKMNVELPRFMAAVRQARQNEAFGVWFNREAGRALRDVPALQPKNPTATGR